MSNSSQEIIFSNQDASADFVSNSFDISRAESASFQVGNILSTDLQGSMKMQVCNDPAYGWNDLPSSVQAFIKTSGIGKSNIWDLTAFGFKNFRFVWTYTSGSGNLTGILNSKG